MKKALKQIAAAAVLATSSLGALAATEKEQTIEFEFVDGFAYGEYSNRFSSAIGAFSDTYTFDLPTWTDAAGSTTSRKLVSRAGTIDLDITNFFITSLDGSKTYGGIQTSTGGKEEWEFEALGMAPGKYVMHVLGNVVGNAGGNYAGQITALSVVPEASTLAMMLAGIGIVGAISRRRKSGEYAPQPAAVAAA